MRILTIFNRIPSGGISSFGNLIIKSFGYTSFQSILFNLPLGAIQIIAIVGGGWLATRFQTKGLVIVLSATLATIGTVMMLTIPRSNKGVLLFGYYLVCSGPGLFSLANADNCRYPLWLRSLP